jgi:hypothetical protein
MRSNRQPDWERVKTLALSLGLPGIEETVSMRQPALKAHGKLWVWWSPHEDAIVFKVPVEEREILIEAEPETFFVTPHYKGYPMVLARPEHLDLAWVRANLVRVWREQTPNRVLKVLDAEQGPADQKPRAKARRVDRGIKAYIGQQSATDRAICDTLMKAIDRHLPEAVSMIWHAHPVWFLDGNPIVGFSKLKRCIRLLFWSGQSFQEDELVPEGKFKAAEIRYTSMSQIDKGALQRWLEKSKTIQWDYKNIVKRKGRLERLR